MYYYMANTNNLLGRAVEITEILQEKEKNNSTSDVKRHQGDDLTFY